MKKPTVYDVARLAGVSVSTVSRFNNQSGYIAKQKVQAIEQAISALGFSAKATKHSGNKARSMRIGVVVPTFDNSYFASILNGMNHCAQGSAYSLRIESSRFSKVREQKIIKQMLDLGVDALILVVSLLNEDEIKHLVGELPILVVAGSDKGSLPILKIDNVIAGKIATNHLIQLGHSKIVHAHGRLTEGPDAQDRLDGYKQSLLEAGLQVDPRLIIDGGYYSESAYNAVLQLINDEISFSAVFAANDLSAYGVIQALKEHDICIPQQVSVIGFDDLYTSEIFTPSLTTIRQPLYEIGEIALSHICDIMSNNASKPLFPPAELIVRDSTSRKGS
ncbi:substrate-binding domain-containing protein [Vibrio comitans]|uniref:LacI family transcriptional regulator n=1 Tax=Vibrio comitans NBRC 102076 TaxID=1219078 RepID=A0A4Y3IK41_9VIBR|nr:substrate-binding domain-containing protein [Vibrio comitans]GEA59094.1 LacI family transcriptional regulator [Vibrio comitans NBRC 102076]